jgi:sulfonate transport system permease protein
MTIRVPALLAHGRAYVLPVSLLLIWEVAAHLRLIDPKFLPPLGMVAARGWSEFQDGNLISALFASLRRNLIGFVIGASLGLSCGIVMGLSAVARRLFGPLLLAHRQIALFAWIPLLSAWFGGGEAGKLAFIALAAFQPTLMNSWRGVADIPARYRELAAVLRFSRFDFIRMIALPGAMPEIFVGLRSALIYSWIATIGAELLLDIAPGLGGRMNEGQQLFEMDLLVFYLFVLGLMGVLLSLVALRLETHLISWKAR